MQQSVRPFVQGSSWVICYWPLLLPSAAAKYANRIGQESKCTRTLRLPSAMFHAGSLNRLVMEGSKGGSDKAETLVDRFDMIVKNEECLVQHSHHIRLHIL